MQTTNKYCVSISVCVCNRIEFNKMKYNNNKMTLQKYEGAITFRYEINERTLECVSENEWANELRT